MGNLPEIGMKINKIFDTTTQYSLHVCKYTVRPMGPRWSAPFFLGEPIAESPSETFGKKKSSKWFGIIPKIWGTTVGGWISAPVEVGSLSVYPITYTYGCFKHPKWCRISSIDGRMSGWKWSQRSCRKLVCFIYLWDETNLLPDLPVPNIFGIKLAVAFIHIR